MGKDRTDQVGARWTAGVFGHLLGQIGLPVKTSATDTVPPDAVARPDGLLPVFLLEAGSVWENVSGDRVTAPLAADPKARLGVRAVGTLVPVPLPGDPEPPPGPLPLTVTLACLTEAAYAMSDGEAIRCDHLVQRWQARLDEVRARPAPRPGDDG